MNRREVGASILAMLESCGPRGATYPEWARTTGLGGSELGGFQGAAGRVWDELTTKGAIVKIGQRRAGAWAFVRGTSRKKVVLADDDEVERDVRSNRRRPELSPELEAQLRAIAYAFADDVLAAIRSAPVREIAAIVTGASAREG